MRNTTLRKSSFSLGLIIFFAGLFSIMLSCGGGGGSSSPGSAPVISSLSWVPQSATYLEGGGAVDVKFDMLFRDSDGDIKTLRVTDSDGGSLTEDISTTMGSSTSGLLTFYIPADTSIIGTFTFQIWLIDSKGNASNQLSGSFTVSPPASPLPMKGTSGNDVNMNGVWTAPCFYSAQNQEDSLIIVTFNGGSFTQIWKTWSASVTSNCTQAATPDVIRNFSGTVTTGATGTAIWMDGNASASAPTGIPANAKATSATITYSSVLVTFQSAAYVTNANLSNLCGGGWVVNVAKNVLNCTDVIPAPTFPDYWVIDDSVSPLKWYSSYDNIAWHVDIKSIMTK